MFHQEIDVGQRMVIVFNVLHANALWHCDAAANSADQIAVDALMLHSATVWEGVFVDSTVTVASGRVLLSTFHVDWSVSSNGGGGVGQPTAISLHSLFATCHSAK